ncbi:tRNA adenylylTrase [Enterospora canceri]|uniref:tRNA adenylylTrase n=1 Tax=Enterospora canceri TaxID=1081671 RepID=A0A1Y1S9K4_9MICR|nr:tRNA adenylylTrase [Enterospora canceri]
MINLYFVYGGLFMFELDEKERLILGLVEEYARTLVPKTVPRVAGGWVRDKLIGIASHDIDIALDTISGEKFVKGLIQYNSLSVKIGKIEANPDKSKHLETIVVNLHGLDVDFVHLRNEKYTESRIPTITVGTPEEDAFRRDITVNALFYNIYTKEIEDFTGRGLNDLKNKIIDTPLDPMKTLLDDPLRILRVFRFHAKLNFTISDRFYQSIKNQNIKDAFRTKVSAERVWAELQKMFSYDNGCSGLLDICKHNFIDPIFKIKADDDIYNDAIRFYGRIKSYLDKNVTFLTTDSKMILKLYIVLHRTIRKYENKAFYNYTILRDALKAPNIICKAINVIESNYQAYMDNMSEDSLIDCLLDSGFHWRIIVVIAYGAGKLKNVADIIEKVDAKELEEKALKSKFKVDGNDLKGLVENKSEIKNLLRKCRVTEIKYPNLTKDEIIGRIMKS